MEFIKEEMELLEIKNDTDGKKNTLAMILSIASLIGVITLLIIMIVS